MKAAAPLLVGSLMLALAALVAACGEGSGLPPSSSPTSVVSATPSPSPSPDELTPSARGDPPATPSLTLDLANHEPIFTVVSADRMDLQTGISSLAVGDFNADGIEDLLFGMPFADGPENSRKEAGEAFLIFGGGSVTGEIDLASEQPGLHILGALPGDSLGFNVTAGDLNGDGIDDIIVGAPGSNGLESIRTDLGEAYVIFGGPDLGGTVDTAKVEQDFTLIAAEGFARVGTSFVVADVNGDGVDDLIAGGPFGGREPGTSPGGPRTTVGEVYVVFGHADLGGGVSVAEDQQDVLLSGARELDAFGQAVAAADVNGDGIADIIVGSHGFDGAGGARRDAGAAFVFFGSRSLGGRLSISDADLTVLGADPDDALGVMLATGDIDGDELADLVLVARTGDGALNDRRNAGEVYVIRGSDSLGGTVNLASDQGDGVIYGPVRNNLMAVSLAVTDLDGDGLADLALGTPLASVAERSSNGVAYVLFSDGFSGVKDLRTNVEDTLFIYGVADKDGLGTGVAAGDLNGDGQPELAVAAAGGRGEDFDNARIFVIALP